MFKTVSGENLHSIMYAIFDFEKLVNASVDMKEISRRAREALMLVGRESRINARRVSKYGIEIKLTEEVTEDKKPR